MIRTGLSGNLVCDRTPPVNVTAARATENFFQRLINFVSCGCACTLIPPLFSVQLRSQCIAMPSIRKRVNQAPPAWQDQRPVRSGHRQTPLRYRYRYRYRAVLFLPWWKKSSFGHPRSAGRPGYRIKTLMPACEYYSKPDSCSTFFMRVIVHCQSSRCTKWPWKWEATAIY